MGQISLSIPQSGQPNLTEDPKVAGDLGTIQTVINGNIDASNVSAGSLTLATLAAAVQQALLPTGTVLHYGGASAPTGFLLCDGSAVSRTTYASLFAVVATAFGAGDGATTFNVPDLRGRSIVGMGAGSGLTNRALAATGGEENHTLSTGELAAHAHGLTDPGHGHATTEAAHGHFFSGFGHVAHGSTAWSTVTINQGGGAPLTLAYMAAGGSTVSDAQGTATATTGLSVNGNSTGISVQNSGSGSGHNNMQPFTVVNHIIKV